MNWSNKFSNIKRLYSWSLERRWQNLFYENALRYDLNAVVQTLNPTGSLACHRNTTSAPLHRTDVRSTWCSRLSPCFEGFLQIIDDNKMIQNPHLFFPCCKRFSGLEGAKGRRISENWIQGISVLGWERDRYRFIKTPFYQTSTFFSTM